MESQTNIYMFVWKNNMEPKWTTQKFSIENVSKQN